MAQDPSSQANRNQNQAVKLSTVGAFIALLVAFGLLLMPLMKSSEEQGHIQSIALAQSVGYQAWELEKRRIEAEGANVLTASAVPAHSSRAPSSVESADFNESIVRSLGQDAWGQAFLYKIRKEGPQTVIDVWSEGPHGVRTQVLIPTSYR